MKNGCINNYKEIMSTRNLNNLHKNIILYIIKSEY